MPVRISFTVINVNKWGMREQFQCDTVIHLWVWISTVTGNIWGVRRWFQGDRWVEYLGYWNTRAWPVSNEFVKFFLWSYWQPTWRVHPRNHFREWVLHYWLNYKGRHMCMSPSMVKAWVNGWNCSTKSCSPNIMNNFIHGKESKTRKTNLSEWQWTLFRGSVTD